MRLAVLPLLLVLLVGVSPGQGVGRHFSEAELTYSATADAGNLPNVPSRWQWEGAHLLVASVLDPLREALGPVVITSGYRAERVNALAGGVPGSAHFWSWDRAGVDFYVKGKPGELVALWCVGNVAWDQLIIYPYHVHIAVARHGNRYQVMIAVPIQGGGWRYEPWNGWSF